MHTSKFSGIRYHAIPTSDVQENRNADLQQNTGPAWQVDASEPRHKKTGSLLSRIDDKACNVPSLLIKSLAPCCFRIKADISDDLAPRTIQALGTRQMVTDIVRLLSDDGTDPDTCQDLIARCDELDEMLPIFARTGTLPPLLETQIDTYLHSLTPLQRIDLAKGFTEIQDPALLNKPIINYMQSALLTILIHAANGQHELIPNVHDALSGNNTALFSPILAAARKGDFIGLLRAFKELEPALPQADNVATRLLNPDAVSESFETLMTFRKEIARRTLAGLSDDKLLHLARNLSSPTSFKLYYRAMEAAVSLLPGGDLERFGWTDQGRALFNRSADLELWGSAVEKELARRGINMPAPTQDSVSDAMIFNIIYYGMDIPLGLRHNKLCVNI